MRSALGLTVAVLAVALLTLITAEPSRASVEDILSDTLRTVPAGTQRIGSYTWIEAAGLGVRLHPAPRSEGFPRLLAGNAAANRHVVAGLYELSDEGSTPLRVRMATDGLDFGNPIDYRFRPRAYGTEVPARLYAGTSPDGAHAQIIDFTVNGRRFALVLRSQPGSDAQVPAQRDAILRELVVAPGAIADSVAPALLDGRYAAVLRGWKRSGDRFFRPGPHGQMGLRLFEVDLSAYAGTDELRLALESELEAAGYRRAAGTRPTVAGREAFMHEYFREDGFVQRVLYTRLDGGYLVLLMQSPAEARDQLREEAERVIENIHEIGIVAPPASWPLPFSNVRNIRVVAWREGNRVLWGVLFDDGRQQPVFWREKDIPWGVNLVQQGAILRQRAGTADSSRTLNPLGNSDARALELPGTAGEDIELEVNVGGVRGSTKVTTR